MTEDSMAAAHHLRLMTREEFDLLSHQSAILLVELYQGAIRRQRQKLPQGSMEREERERFRRNANQILEFVPSPEMSYHLALSEEGAYRWEVWATLAVDAPPSERDKYPPLTLWVGHYCQPDIPTQLKNDLGIIRQLLHFEEKLLTFGRLQNELKNYGFLLPNGKICIFKDDPAGDLDPSI